MAFSNEPQTFTVNVTGETTGEQYPGKFKVKPMLTHRDSLRRDQYRRDLIGTQGGDAGPRAANIAEIFSKIWSHLLDAPKWWTEAGNGLDLVDEAPAVAVYEAVVKAEKDAYGQLQKEADGAREELKKVATEEKK